MGVLTGNVKPRVKRVKREGHVMVNEKVPDEPSENIVIIFKRTPKCVTAKQYKAWKEAARVAELSRFGFCTDCTKQYQAKMIAQGRCAHPEIEFRTKGKYLNEGFIREQN